MAREVVATYADAATARAAFEDVLATGHPRDRMQLDLGGTRAVRLEAREDQDRAGMRGALTGMGVGAVIGALVAIILGLIPTVGWVLGNDPSGSIIGSAFAGALLGFAAGGLGRGVRSQPPPVTAPEGERGPATVRVDVEDAELSTVANVLRRHRPTELRLPEERPAFEPVGPRPAEPGAGSRVLDLDMARRQVRPEREPAEREPARSEEYELREDPLSRQVRDEPGPNIRRGHVNIDRPPMEGEEEEEPQR